MSNQDALLARAGDLLSRLEALLSRPSGTTDWNHIAYRWRGQRGLQPVARPHQVRLDDLLCMDRQKAEVARKAGYLHVINYRREDPVERVRQITDTLGAHSAEVFWVGLPVVGNNKFEPNYQIISSVQKKAVRKAGGIDLPTIQKYINFWFTASLDLFGGEISSNAADYFASGLKGRAHEEKKFEDHVAMEGEYAIDVVDNGKIERRTVPMRTAMNEILRDAYVDDNQRGVDRWNKIIRGAGIDFDIFLSAPGTILGLTIMLEVGDINRFFKVGHYSSYCRCVESKKISNGKKKGENNKKNGNRYLAWAYVEAANHAIRACSKAQRFFQRKIAKRNRVLATKGLANKLTKATSYIMRDQLAFDAAKLFG